MEETSGSQTVCTRLERIATLARQAALPHVSSYPPGRRSHVSGGLGFGEQVTKRASDSPPVRDVA